MAAPRPQRASAGEHHLLRACRTFSGLLLTGASAVHGGHRLDHVGAALLVARIPFRRGLGDLRGMHPSPCRIVLQVSDLGEQLLLNPAPARRNTEPREEACPKGTPGS